MFREETDQGFGNGEIGVEGGDRECIRQHRYDRRLCGPRETGNMNDKEDLS